MRGRPILLLIVLILCGFLVGIPILIIWWLVGKTTRLEVTNVRSRLRKGILSKRTTEVRHVDVRNLSVSQGLLQRILGVGNIAISSAGQGGIEIELVGIGSPNKVANTIRQYQD